MKRILTYEEVQDVIKFEDSCGVNDLLQQLLSGRDKAHLGKNVQVIGEFNEQGELGECEVVEICEVGGKTNGLLFVRLFAE